VGGGGHYGGEGAKDDIMGVKGRNEAIMGGGGGWGKTG
jgi:hypothetical protein